MTGQLKQYFERGIKVEDSNLLILKLATEAGKIAEGSRVPSVLPDVLVQSLPPTWLLTTVWNSNSRGFFFPPGFLASWGTCMHLVHSHTCEQIHVYTLNKKLNKQNLPQSYSNQKPHHTPIETNERRQHAPPYLWSNDFSKSDASIP